MLGGGLAAALLAADFAKLQIGPAPRKQRKLIGPDARAATATVANVVREPDRLVAMFALVRETLDALARIGEAFPESE